MKKKRADREDIFAHLRAIVGEESITICQQVAALYHEGKHEESLDRLKKFDATLGGVGIYLGQRKKLPGIYRGLSYNEIPMLHGCAEDETRLMIICSCGYLEELIKKWLRLSLIEMVRDSYKDGIPLGPLLYKLKGHVPPELLQELRWINDDVYVYAKHKFSFEEEHLVDGDAEPDHYFLLDEAIAIYFMVRVLGSRMEKLSGRSQEEFLNCNI